MGVASSYKHLQFTLLTPFTCSNSLHCSHSSHRLHCLHCLHCLCCLHYLHHWHCLHCIYSSHCLHCFNSFGVKKLLCLYVIWLYCFVWVAEKKVGRTNGWYCLDCCDYQSTDTIQYYNNRYSCLTHLYTLQVHALAFMSPPYLIRLPGGPDMPPIP